MADVFKKTPLAYEELETRQYGLSMVLRRILIMIDGERDMIELINTLQIPDIHLLVQSLEVQGFIEFIGVSEG